MTQPGLERFTTKLVGAAYFVFKPNALAKELENLQQFSNEWSVIAKSTDSVETQKYHYKAIAFINKDTKQVMIANAGTVPQDLYDLYDDLKLATYQIHDKFNSIKSSIGIGTKAKSSTNSFGVPTKIAPMKSFVTMVLDNLQQADPENYADYTFNTAGHSLGAVMSDLCAVELNARGLKVDSSLTYDNPGAKSVIESAIHHNLLSKNVDLAQVTQDIDFTAYNAELNLINTCNEPLGKVELTIKSLDIPAVIEKSKSDYFKSYVKSAFNKVKSMTGIDKIVSQVKHIVNSHSLGSFDEYFNNQDVNSPTLKVGLWSSEAVVLDPNAEQLETLTKVSNTNNNDSQLYLVAADADSFVKIDKYDYETILLAFDKTQFINQDDYVEVSQSLIGESIEVATAA